MIKWGHSPIFTSIFT